MPHYGRSRWPKRPIFGRALISAVAVSLTDTPSAVRQGGPDGSLVLDVVLADTASATRHGGPDGTGIAVAPATDTPAATRHGGADGSLVIADAYTDTPSASRYGGPGGVLSIDLAVTDSPSASRYAGPEGSAQVSIIVGPDSPSATRYAGPDGTVSPDLAVTDRPSALRHGRPDGSVAIGIVQALDTPSASRYAGPAGSVFADIGGGVSITDTPGIERYAGPDGVLAIGVTVALDSPSASRYAGPDGVLVIGVTVTDTAGTVRYAGPDGIAVVLVGATDTPSALRAGGPDGAMGIVVPVRLDTPSAIRHAGPAGSLSIGIGADTLVTLGSPAACRYGGPSGDVLLAYLPTRVPYVSPAPITAPGYALWVADTVTGRMLWELPLETMSWSTTLTWDGTISATLDIEKTWDSLSDQDERDPRVRVRELLSGPWRFCLVVVWGNQPVWAGPYVSLSRPKPSQVQVGGPEIVKIFSKRLLVNPAYVIGPADVSGDTVIGPSTTKGHAAAVLLNQAMTGTGRSLPITVIDPGGVGSDSRTYYGYDLAKVADALRNLANEDDGPELRFDPVITAGSDANYLGWVAQIGSPHLGRGVTPWTFDDDVSLVSTLSTDASTMALSLWAAGTGSSRDKIMANASDTSLLAIGYPLLEEVDTNTTSQTDPKLLQSAANAALGVQRKPAVSFQVTIPVDRDPMPGTYHLGEDFQITVQDDPTIEDGVYLRRIAGIAGTEGPWVTLTDTAPLPVGST